ncbi:MAG TPA: DUF1538 domain-containing protein [Steroidobacteraceae bacterium]|jgi:hypothetical protein|nr:DUF1538 domain-containing protein [Steroidobacteraceae bacterium]
MSEFLRSKIVETLQAVGPLIGLICLLQIAFVGASAATFLQFLVGAVLVTAGLLLLFIGIDLGILPMGRFIGAGLSEKRSVPLMLAVAFAMGFATTAAEPDVLVLAEQAQRASDGMYSARFLIYSISLGVGLFVAIAMMRMISGFSMAWQFTVTYALMILLSFAASEKLVPLAYDAGSVTTGVLTGPAVVALARGVSSVLAGRSAVADTFGLLGMASLGPIIFLLILGLLR